MVMPIVASIFSENDFKLFKPEQLPEAPGVVVVCCPHGPNATTYSEIALENTENVRLLAQKMAMFWARNCTHYIEYLVAVRPDPESRRELIGTLRQAMTTEGD